MFVTFSKALSLHCILGFYVRSMAYRSAVGAGASITVIGASGSRMALTTWSRTSMSATGWLEGLLCKDYSQAQSSRTVSGDQLVIVRQPRLMMHALQGYPSTTTNRLLRTIAYNYWLWILAVSLAFKGCRAP